MQHTPTRLDHEHEYVAGDLALDFANTLGGSRDRVTHDHLVRYADLVTFLRGAGELPATLADKLLTAARKEPDAAAAVLRRAVALREAIWAVFSPRDLAKAPHVSLISDEAARAASHLRIARRGEGFAHVWSDDPDLERVLWPIARSASELLISDMDRALVRECESETCSWLFLDRTRNHSRRWCDMGDCGNRAKARRYRERRQKKAASA